jgi:hypothetical protein
MKFALFPLACIACFLANIGSAQTIKTWYWGANSDVPLVLITSNQVAEVVNLFLDRGADARLKIICPTNQSLLSLNWSFNSTNFCSSPITVAGPATFSIIGPGFVTLKISEIPQQITPSTSVVIPTDSTGPVDIVLESSTDLVNWTASLPGTYGANSTNRFFRVRAVRQ